MNEGPELARVAAILAEMLEEAEFCCDKVDFLNDEGKQRVFWLEPGGRFIINTSSHEVQMAVSHHSRSPSDTQRVWGTALSLLVAVVDYENATTGVRIRIGEVDRIYSKLRKRHNLV